MRPTLGQSTPDISSGSLALVISTEHRMMQQAIAKNTGGTGAMNKTGGHYSMDRAILLQNQVATGAQG